MGFSFELAARYMSSKKRAFVSVGTVFAVIGVALGVAALVTVVSVTGGFMGQFRDKVLGVNAHVLVLRYSGSFKEYRKVMADLESVPGIEGISPFVINPMMVTHENRTATGVLLKGVDPKLVSSVLDLPGHIVEPSRERFERELLPSWRLSGAKPPVKRADTESPTGLDSLLLSPTEVKPEETKRTPLLEAIRQRIEEDEARDRGAAGQTAPRVESGEPTLEALVGVGETETEQEGVEGSVVPNGGYDSELPDDDVLPAELGADPCGAGAGGRGLPGIVIGKTLKENLQVKLGDCVHVTSPTIGYSFQRGAIRAPVAKPFRVMAVFDWGFDQYDSKLMFTDLYEAQAFYGSGDTVTGVEMKVHDVERAKDLVTLVKKKLVAGPYHVMDWEELNHSLFTALKIQQLLMSIVLALIIVVAAFTVLATLIMLVLDKRKDIAVLKAIGASDGFLMRTFLYQGALIGVVGTVGGLGLGLLVCRALARYKFALDASVYFISELPVQVKFWQFGLVGLFAMLVCLGATIWPAVYASRLRPAEAFREQ